MRSVLLQIVPAHVLDVGGELDGLLLLAGRSVAIVFCHGFSNLVSAKVLGEDGGCGEDFTGGVCGPRAVEDQHCV